MRPITNECARLVGLRPAGGRPPTWDQIMFRAGQLYWQRRPNPTEVCGTWYGYRAHRRRGHTACEPCRKAYAMVMAIWRLRESRSLNRDGSPRDVRPDGWIQPPLVASVPTGPAAGGEHGGVDRDAVAGDRLAERRAARGGAADPEAVA